MDYPLTTGERYKFDFDDVWLVEDEFEALFEKGGAVPWITDPPPILGSEYEQLLGVTVDQFACFLFCGTLECESVAPFRFSDHSIETSQDPQECCQHYHRLLRESADLKSRFSESQLDAGIWNLTNPEFGGSVVSLLSNQKLPIREKVALVASLPGLFEGLIAAEPLGTGGYMFWDCLLSYLRPSPCPELREALVSALEAVLRIESDDCKVSALHGLNHLGGSDSKSVIAAFMEECENPELIEFARLCFDQRAQ